MQGSRGNAVAFSILGAFVRQSSGMLIRRFTLALIALFSSTILVRANTIDLVRVDKSDRRLELLSGDKILRSYAVAFGANFEGHKGGEGDEPTSEGRYVLDWRNPGNSSYREIH